MHPERVSGLIEAGDSRTITVIVLARAANVSLPARGSSPCRSLGSQRSRTCPRIGEVWNACTTAVVHGCAGGGGVLVPATTARGQTTWFVAAAISRNNVLAAGSGERGDVGDRPGVRSRMSAAVRRGQPGLRDRRLQALDHAGSGSAGLPLRVGGAGLTPGSGLFTSAPTEGKFACLHGFDGFPGTIRVAQDFAVPAGTNTLQFDYRAGWDLTRDATLDRTTNGTGRVQNKTLAEVRQLDAGSWFDPKYRDQRVPTLKEVLVLCGDKIDVLLDLKQQGEEYAKAVVAEVKAHGSPKRTIVGVRSVEQARLFRRLLPQAQQLGLIPNEQAIEAFAKADVETIRLWPKWLKDDANLVRRVRKAGAKLHLNGTTGKPDDVLPLLQHKPDSLSSDDPARLVQTLAEL